MIAGDHRINRRLDCGVEHLGHKHQANGAHKRQQLKSAHAQQQREDEDDGAGGHVNLHVALGAQHEHDALDRPGE